MINYGRQTLNSLDFKEVLKVLKSDYITQGKIINNFEDGTYFDSSLLKNILSVNKNCGEGLIKFSSQGMLHYVFNEGTFTTNYYMTSKENV